eukprot:SAG11_NODE_15079_length_590_cov_0.596741_2_plen_101_part_01
MLVGNARHRHADPPKMTIACRHARLAVLEAKHEELRRSHLSDASSRYDLGNKHALILDKHASIAQLLQALQGEHDSTLALLLEQRKAVHAEVRAAVYHTLS